MELKELFTQINNNIATNKLIIFEANTSYFLADQYINAIAKCHSLNRQRIENLEDLNVINTFYDPFDGILKVYFCEKFSVTDLYLKNISDLIIVCNSISEEAKNIFNTEIVKLPKLEEWQLKDFILSQLPGLSHESLNCLFKLCKNDPYRIQLEIDRLKIFNKEDQIDIFNDFYYNDIYDDLVSSSIFDLSNAIIQKNIFGAKKAIQNFYKQDENPLGLIAILYTNFKNVLKIQSDPLATAESCNLKSNQFYAIKNNNINYYSIAQLEQIFIFLTELDLKFKAGKIPIENLLDYLIIKIFSF